MSLANAYLLGLVTLPVLAGIWLLIRATINSDYDVECDQCGKILGTEGKTWAALSGFRWKIHYLRYWYRSRPEWTCEAPKKSS